MTFCESPSPRLVLGTLTQLPMIFSIFLPILEKAEAANIAPIVTIHINISLFLPLTSSLPLPLQVIDMWLCFWVGSESFYSYISIAIMWQRCLIKYQIKSFQNTTKKMVKGSLNPILFSSYIKLLQINDSNPPLNSFFSRVLHNLCSKARPILTESEKKHR